MSCFCCCNRTREQLETDNELAEAVKPSLVVINILDSDGVLEQATGILISDHLVLTSHMELPSMGSADGGQVVLTAKASSTSSPHSWQSPSTILTRKLLPQRLFVTSPALGLTIVACEAANSSSSPTKYEVPKAAEDGLKLSCSVYVLGQVQHDDRQGLLMFGQGLVSKEDEHVIEFYSLDGYVWAPGSAGFDAKGTFAFVVGDRHPSRNVTCPFPKRWSYAMSEGPRSTQRGILIHAVRDWTPDAWSGEFSSLSELCNSAPSSGNPNPAHKISAQKLKALERQKALREQFNEIQIKGEDEGAVATVPRVRTIRSNLEDFGKSFYGATDSTSTITSPKIKEIPVQASFPHSLSWNNVDSEVVSSLYLKSQSPANLGGIATLAAEELERHDEKVVLQACDQRLAVIDSREECKVTHGTETPENELRSPQSCWLSSWWNNLRPKSPRQQRGNNLHAAVPCSREAAVEWETHDARKKEEDATNCFESDSPPRRFLVRGDYTAAPRRDFSSPQTTVLSEEATKPTISEPCELTILDSTETFFREVSYFQISQSEPEPSEETDTGRMQPSDPPQLLSDRIPRPREDEQKELEEGTPQKVSAETCTSMKVEDRTTQQSNAANSQDNITTAPYQLYGRTVLESEACTCSPESKARQSTTHQDNSEEMKVTLLQSNLDNSTTSRPRITPARGSHQRKIECTCFQKWHKFVIRKKNLALESMRSLFSPSPRTFSVSTASSRSASPSPTLDASSPRQPTSSSHPLVSSKPLSDDGTYLDDAAPWCLVSPSSAQTGESGCPEEQGEEIFPRQPPLKEQASVIVPVYKDKSCDEKMPKWAMTQYRTSDETLNLVASGQKFVPYDRGRDSNLETPEPAASQVVKIWDGSCIATFNLLGDENIGAEDESPHMDSTSETTSTLSPRVEKQRNDQRKAPRDQRPRWSIARVDKGPLNTGSLFNHSLEDQQTKCKLRVKNPTQPSTNITADMRAMVSQEEGTLINKLVGVKTSAVQNNESVVRKGERQEGAQTRPPSPRRKPALDTNCRPKTASTKALCERSPSPRRQAGASPVHKRSSLSSSSSDREGRPRWRC
ncbi:hypothetical protein R1sor_018442 [Riccia sorocarpa]|uniref:Uncharacterized protein n=1 Tax=Riccia sorocarpa TaxID=122646 RepID=A0ABD3IDA2_9MARC